VRTHHHAAARRGLTLHSARPTLLGVWAHPDDEAYLSAGLMAQFAERGGRVVVVTATYGEAGTDDPATWPPMRLAAHRQRELHDSLRVLGVDEVHILGLPDGGCDRFDATEAIADHIDRARPDLIVTFGPDGLTGHTDHRAVSKWTTTARQLIRPQADLWYTTVTPEFHHRWSAVNDAANFFYPDQPDTPCTPISELVHHIALPDGLLDLKLAALAAHSTQTSRLIELVGLETYREWWRTESFRRAAATAEHLQFADLDDLAA
jgi:LmbE family N-acetylglucosaminyl deacetylase